MDDESTTLFSHMDIKDQFLRFFQHDAGWLTADRSPDNLVRIRGLRRPLFQFQALGVFWVLTRWLGGNGCAVVGDYPGLGKTIQAECLWVLWVNLGDMYDEVARSRQRNDRQHLAKGVEAGVCPSAAHEKYGFECSCVPGSAAQRWEATYCQDHDGGRWGDLPFLFLVKPANIDNWISSIHEDVDLSGLGLKLYQAHATSKGNGGYNFKDHAEEIFPAAGDDTSDSTTARNAVITTPLCWDSMIHKRFCGSVAQKEAGWFEQVYGTFGVVIVDEFHENLGGTAGFGRLVDQINCIAVVLLSGTPFGSSPEKISNWYPQLLGITHEQAKNPETLAPHVRDRLKRLQDATQNYRQRGIALQGLIDADDTQHLERRRAQENFEAANAQFSKLLSRYMIRRKKLTLWYDGKPISPVDETMIDYVRISNSPAQVQEKKAVEMQLLRDLEALRESEKAKTGIFMKQLWDRAMQDNTFPALREYEKKGLVPEMTNYSSGVRVWYMLQARGADKDPTKSPYYPYIAEIVKGSAKCEQIEKYIRDLGRFPDTGELEKLLIGAFHPVVTHIVFLVSLVSRFHARTPLTTPSM